MASDAGIERASGIDWVQCAVAAVAPVATFPEAAVDASWLRPPPGSSSFSMERELVVGALDASGRATVWAADPRCRHAPPIEGCTRDPGSFHSQSGWALRRGG